MFLLLVMKITIEKKPSELGKNLDILRKNFKHFRIVSHWEGPPALDFAVENPLAKIFYEIYMNP